MTTTKKPPRPATARGRGRQDESTGDTVTRSRGRPALPDDERRTMTLDVVRVSPAEMRELQRRAAKAGERLSEWVRERLLGG